MKRNVTLDGLRGIAAICVLLYHLGSLLDLPVMPGGYLAVDFFFCLSGYVLAKAYGDRLGVLDLTWRRVARLYPVFLFGLALGLAKVAAQTLLGVEQVFQSGADFARALVLNALMLPDLMGPIYPFNGPAWTLFLEMVLSIAFAALLCRMRAIGLVTLALLGAVGMIWAVTAYGWLNVGWDAETLPFGLARAVYGFCAGMLIARWVRDERVHRVPWAVLLLILGMLVPDLLFALVLSPLIVALGARTDLDERLKPLFAWAGNVSYPLYAVHWPIAVAVVFAGFPLPVALVLGVAVPVIAADLALRFYDRPVRRWLTSFRAIPAG